VLAIASAGAALARRENKPFSALVRRDGAGVVSASKAAAAAADDRRRSV